MRGQRKYTPLMSNLLKHYTFIQRRHIPMVEQFGEIFCLILQPQPTTGIELV
jgi:hypothetical protein